MRFNLLALTTTLLTAGTAHGASEITPRTAPSDVTGVLTSLTSSVGNTNAVVTQINGFNAFYQVPLAVESIGGLITQIELSSVALNLAGGSLPIPSVTDQTAICTALGSFLTAFTSLITTISLEEATLNGDELGPLLTPTLNTVLTVVEVFVTGVVTVVPVCGAAYTLQLGTVETTVSGLITALS